MLGFIILRWPDDTLCWNVNNGSANFIPQELEHKLYHMKNPKEVKNKKQSIPKAQGHLPQR
jgi:hypothetical protein